MTPLRDYRRTEAAATPCSAPAEDDAGRCEDRFAPVDLRCRTNAEEVAMIQAEIAKFPKPIMDRIHDWLAARIQSIRDRLGYPKPDYDQQAACFCPAHRHRTWAQRLYGRLLCGLSAGLAWARQEDIPLQCRWWVLPAVLVLWIVCLGVGLRMWGWW